MGELVLRGLKMVLCAAGLCLVAACGDEGGSPRPTPTPSSSPSPSPTPSPGVASFSQGTPVSPRIVYDFDAPIKFHATNRGIYALLDPPVADGASVVVKLHGDPADAGAWSVVEPEVIPPGTVAFGPPPVHAIAPVDAYAESDRAFDFYWLSTDAWGRYTAGVAPVRNRRGAAIDPVSGLDTRPFMIASGGSTAGRSWYVSQRQNRTDAGYSFGVYQDDGAYTGAGTIEDRFSTPASPPLQTRPNIVVAHPTEPLLYIAAGNAIYVYDRDKAVRSFAFPAPAVQGFTDLAWAQGDLYVSYNSDVWKLAANSAEPVPFTPLPANSPKTQGRFCIAGGELYLTDGEAVDLQTKLRRNWIKQGALSASQSEVADMLLQTLGRGIYCSPAKAQPEVYTTVLNADSRFTVRRIIPLAR